ncbi:MAG: HDIG domain-containing protein [Chloroflexi bacterium]|nr:HDIG domain-containing protein [Chloroflexota bacterium]
MNERAEVQAVLSTSSQLADERMKRVLWVVIGMLYLLVGLIIMTFDTLVPLGGQVRFEVGDIPQQDIFAPESRTYESAVLTEERRQQAIRNVEPIYTRVSSIARDQRDLMRDIVAYMNMVIDDPYAADEQKLADHEAITALTDIDQTTWQAILASSEDSTRWALLTADLVNALETTMGRNINPTEASLSDALGALRDNNVSIDLTDSEKEIVIVLVSELVVPNTVLDEEATEAERQRALSEVEPFIRTFRTNETIITKGRPITEADIEALQIFGLQQTNRSTTRTFLSALLVLFVVSGGMLLYIARFYPAIIQSTRLMLVLASMFLIFMAVARAFGPDWIDQQRLYPAAALALLVTALVGPHLSTVLIAGLALLVGTMGDNSMELVVLVAVGGIAGALSLRDIERLNSYFSAGLIIGLVNVVIVLAFLANDEEVPEFITLLSESLLAFANGLLSAAVALVGLFVIGAIANLTTSVKLIELMQPNQPLLQLLLRKAPGTYQHSLQVANLAELAAERIGANATLIRVAAMYHDIGKTLNPQFFVENQAEGFNPHDDLNDPQRSARLIIGHVAEGERLARRHRLPQRIRDFIREHHGTMKPWYFYYQAIEKAGGDESKVNLETFTYPGPIPQSKETAILLLADGTESTARAIRPRTHEEVANVVNKIMERALQDGQLDESNLTLNDLKVIREVFIETLQAIYHPRIAYKEPVKVKGEQPKQLAEPDSPVVEEKEGNATPVSTPEPEIKKEPKQDVIPDGKPDL